MINGISQIENFGNIVSKSSSGPAQSDRTFSGMLDELLEETARNIEKSDQSVMQANTGGPVDLHDVMIAMEKADISLRLLVQVRNKAVDAYHEIMRMQV